MTSTQLVALLGQPAEKKIRKTASGEVEIWTYHRYWEELVGITSDGTVAVNTTSRDNMGNPMAVAGASMPTYRQQFGEIEETTLIMLVGGQVQTWDRTDRRTGSVR